MQVAEEDFLPDRLSANQDDWAQHSDAVLEYAKKWVLQREPVKLDRSSLAK